MDCKIRMAIETDLTQILKLYEDNKLPFLKNDINKMIVKYGELVNLPNYYVLVAEKDDEILGTVSGIICESICDGGKPFMVIENMVVKKEWRRNKIATRLHEFLDVIAVENNCVYAIIVSSVERNSAHEFIKKSCGFDDPVVGFRKLYIKREN